jgi:hypothetical protein
MTTVQPTNLPTNKMLTTAVGTVGIAPIIMGAVAEVWPQIAPAALAGQAMTVLVGTGLAALISMGIAWFVPDRANIIRQ